MRTAIVASSVVVLVVTVSVGCRRDATPQAGPGSGMTLRQDNIIDDYHGEKVADPFRWLENPDLPETAEFVSANNRRFRAYLSEDVRQRIRDRMAELLNYPRVSAPSIRGQRYVFSRNDGLQNQSVVHVADTRGQARAGQARVLIDPNALSEDGTVSLSGMDFTQDGALVAIALSESGSDQAEVRIREVAGGTDRPDVLKWMKFSSIAWLPDNSGFYYNRYPAPGTVAPADEARYNRLYHHRLGDPQEKDRLVFAPDDPEVAVAPWTTEDGRYVVLHLSRGTSPKNRLMVIDLAKGDEKPVPLFDKEDASYSVVANDGPVFYVYTDRDAPRGRVVAVTLGRSDPAEWRTIVPQADDVIDSVSCVADRLVITYSRDAYHVLKVFRLDGVFERDIPLPTVGTVSLAGADRRHREVFFTFTSFTYPSTSFRFDFDQASLEEHYRPPVRFDPDGYEAKQLFATSRDGTRVPLFVVHRKGLALDGTNPTLLSGYGGFRVSMSPYFNVTLLPFLEQGGVFALAVVRGGGEYGETWHAAGMLGNKQKVFDDFIACAEKLVADGYTSPNKLSIEGGSNGGLLTAAVMLQRPDLFGAVVSAVPVTDMLRYHKLGVGRFWVPEYGSSDDPKQFAFLRAYSPLHNVKPNVVYPPLLVTTAEGDDRVVPAHAFKFVATLQSVSSSPNPVLLRTETKAGHGGGKPISKVLDEEADVFAFLARALRIDW